MTDETEGQVDEPEDETPDEAPEPSEKDGNPTEAQAVLDHRARLKAIDEKMAK